MSHSFIFSLLLVFYFGNPLGWTEENHFTPRQSKPDHPMAIPACQCNTAALEDKLEQQSKTLDMVGQAAYKSLLRVGDEPSLKMADKLLKQLGKSNPGFEHTERARKDLEKGNAKAALMRLNNIKPKSSSYANSLALKADAYKELKDWPNALNSIKRARKINPNDEPLKLLEAGLLIDSGQFDKAHASIDPLLKKKPNDPNLQNLKAYAWAVQGENLDQAEKLVDTALKKSRFNYGFKDTKGWIQYQKGKLAEEGGFKQDAQKFYQQASQTLSGIPPWHPDVAEHAVKAFSKASPFGGPVKSPVETIDAYIQQRSASLSGRTRARLLQMRLQAIKNGKSR